MPPHNPKQPCTLDLSRASHPTFQAQRWVRPRVCCSRAMPTDLSGLALQLKKRVSREFQFLAFYTSVRSLWISRPGPRIVPGGEYRLLSDGSQSPCDRAHQSPTSGIDCSKWRMAVELCTGMPAPAKAIAGAGSFRGNYEGCSLGCVFRAGEFRFEQRTGGGANSATDRTSGELGPKHFIYRDGFLDRACTRNVHVHERVTPCNLSGEAFSVEPRNHQRSGHGPQFSRYTSAARLRNCGDARLVPQDIGTNQPFGTHWATSGPESCNLPSSSLLDLRMLGRCFTDFTSSKQPHLFVSLHRNSTKHCKRYRNQRCECFKTMAARGGDTHPSLWEHPTAFQQHCRTTA